MSFDPRHRRACSRPTCPTSARGLVIRDELCRGFGGAFGDVARGSGFLAVERTALGKSLGRASRGGCRSTAGRSAPPAERAQAGFMPTRSSGKPMADRESEVIAQDRVRRLGPQRRGLGPRSARAIRSSAMPSCRRSRIRAASDPGTGWTPAPILDRGRGRRLVAAAPAYLKSHSQGEYVFDHGWAEAWERAGGEYYPKLQVAVPFTPVPGPRLLGQPAAAAARRDRGGDGARTTCRRRTSPSSTRPALRECERRGWLIRHGIQYPLVQPRLCELRRFPRRSVAAASARRSARSGRRRVDGLDIRILRGAEIGRADWDAMWAFYQDTGSRKWGRPYLTREFFALLGERMGDQVLLFLACRDGRPIAGALNFIGADTLYGRYWGCGRGGAVPPFRALLLSGDRMGDRARPAVGPGRRAGRAQVRARL